MSLCWLTKSQRCVLLHDVSHSYCINTGMRFVIFHLEGKCIPLIPLLVLFYLSLARCVLLSCWADLNIINFLFTQVWVTEVLKWLDFNYIAVIFFWHGKRERDIREKLPAAAVKRQWMCGAGEHGKGDLHVIPAFPSILQGAHRLIVKLSATNTFYISLFMLSLSRRGKNPDVMFVSPLSFCLFSTYKVYFLKSLSIIPFVFISFLSWT